MTMKILSMILTHLGVANPRLASGFNIEVEEYKSSESRLFNLKLQYQYIAIHI